MFVFRNLLLLFLIVPIIEIYLLIQVGSLIGALPTVVLVVLTAVLGAALLRSQGFATLGRIQATMARGEVPAIELMEGAMLLFGGALLLTPGFFTDAIGFVCLLPQLRKQVVLWLIKRGMVSGTVVGGGAAPSQQGSRTIEGEYWDDEKNKRS